MISLIAAVNEDFVLAKNGNIPWRCKEDLQFFKKMTINKTVVMGRKTYNTLKKPLNDRLNIVLTKDKESIDNDEIIAVSSIEESIECFNKYNFGDNKEMFVIGGLFVYNQFLEKNLIDKIFLNVIKKNKVEINDNCLIFNPDISDFNLYNQEDNDFFTNFEYNRK